MYELIICEKPAAAQKVALALAEGKLKKEAYKGAPYYVLKYKNKDIVVGAAVGHLFGLAEKVKTKGFEYPVFDIEWLPAFVLHKESDYTKKYIDCLKKLAKDASTVTIACDYDTEGEVIGLNIVRFICNRNDARRMKFSTLTKQDLITAYEKTMPRLDWGQAEAGETRHYLDYYYGINISRALTKALNTAGLFKILSTGRVQGPALKIIVEREKEIKAFKPVPYWEISMNGMAKEMAFEAWHATDKFWKKPDAQVVMQRVEGKKTATVASIDKQEFKQSPPPPFDLTTLQTEAYRLFGINPKATLEIAQDLYTGGAISYPRTSSQQLPPAIGYAGILSALSKQKDYKELATALLKQKELMPHDGKKTDPAHPAIYPTGLAPKNIEGRQEKIYDLIVKRFFATFGSPATRESVVITLEISGEQFLLRGSRTKEQGWHVFYAPYVRLEEVELPALKKGESVAVKKITLYDKETQPPKRYTPASIIKELEKRNLGTKSTRAEIIHTLSQRQYVAGESLQATELGMHIVDVLEKYSPKILDEELTRHFELDMDAIREHTKKKEEVLSEARNVLKEILEEFRHKEKDIGAGLKDVIQQLREQMSTVGPCLVCKKGTLMIKRGKFGLFIACNQYPECKTTFKMPSGKVLVSAEVCEQCKHPKLLIIKKAKKPLLLCINPDCPTKQVDASQFKEKQCPKCKEGMLVLRKSIYGAFIACNRYPKCRYIQKLEKKEDAAAPSQKISEKKEEPAPAQTKTKVTRKKSKKTASP